MPRCRYQESSNGPMDTMGTCIDRFWEIGSGDFASNDTAVKIGKFRDEWTCQKWCCNWISGHFRVMVALRKKNHQRISGMRICHGPEKKNIAHSLFAVHDRVRNPSCLEWKRRLCFSSESLHNIYIIVLPENHNHSNIYFYHYWTFIYSHGHFCFPAPHFTTRAQTNLNEKGRNMLKHGIIFQEKKPFFCEFVKKMWKDPDWEILNTSSFLNIQREGWPLLCNDLNLQPSYLLAEVWS